VAVLRLFAGAREAAGTGRDHVSGDTVAQVLAAAGERYGEAFVEVLGTCRVWVNGDEATDDMAVGEADEVAVLPPVSGGAS
jgi:molybdopterin converting factor small subunit